MLIEVNPEDLDKAHQLAKRLTGDPWIPYSSGLFVHVLLRVEDEISRSLIKERRTFSFPQFLGGDPQETKLRTILSSLNR